MHTPVTSLLALTATLAAVGAAAGADATIPETASEYARMCATYVGVVPTLNCDDGVPIPIYVNGNEVFEHQQPGSCDDFDFKGTCNIGSRIGRISSPSGPSTGSL